MFLIVLLSATILLCYKYGDWRNWKKYNATILFFIAGDLLHTCLTVEKPLWYYQSDFLKGFTINLLIMVIIYPGTLLMLLPEIEKPYANKIVIFTKWIVIYSIGELIANRVGLINHKNGWNLYYSVAFNIVMFPLLWLHYKKPLLAYLLSAVIALIIMSYFNIQISEIWSHK